MSVNEKTLFHCEVTAQAIEVHRFLKCVFDTQHGAMSWFLGQVREVNHGRKVVQVNYDCHPVFAQRVFEKIANEASQQWGEDLKAVIVHRKGVLRVGEISILIGVSTRHRAEAYSASRYIIEQIKVRAPIWKQEVYEDGKTEWLKGHALCQHSGPISSAET